MVNSSVVACFPAFLAGLGSQGKSKEAGVALVWRISNSSLIFLRSVSFFAKSLQAVRRTIKEKMTWKEQARIGPKHRAVKMTYIVDISERFDSAALTTVPPLVGFVEDVFQ